MQRREQWPGPDADGSARERRLAVDITHDNLDDGVPAEQLTSHTAETLVALGNGPDLGLSQAEYQRGLRPGTDTSVRATVANSGNRAVDRTLLWLSASYGLRFKEQEYALVTELGVGRKALYERFDRSVEPYSDERLEDVRGD
ncbi:hypothetical protein QQY66_04815 [Streptomyces sp. DG2A-72]|uniref:hypothetical protein n=1 Tax=Streptomyces sp. DG2A-72 TaxID=3051386 RepID=UPI00265B98E7|nr:hypothetical protein [Streptomyces sp. DG2A-72]MDO0931034.1 hypothetical protein [Streptomyces sp. DG2A-72]